jgi:hypothetical protein
MDAVVGEIAEWDMPENEDLERVGCITITDCEDGVNATFGETDTAI